MKIRVNGNTVDAAENTNLRELVHSYNIKPEAVIIELNERVMRREIWGDTVLMEGDRIELISFVGGG